MDKMTIEQLVEELPKLQAELKKYQTSRNFDQQERDTINNLYEISKDEQKKLEEEGAIRRSKIGTGDRSEKIRTYNFPQDRITDHRIGYTAHNLADFMNGNIQPLLDALSMAENAAKLTEL